MAATLVGTVWHDLNSDGVQTGGEPGLQYAVAELFSSTNGTIGDADDVSLGTRITDAAGNYQFTGLVAGVNHFVVVRPPVGFAFTVQDTGPDATDSDVSATGRSAMFAPVELSTVDLDAGLTGAVPAFGWGVQQGQGSGSVAAQDVAVTPSGDVYTIGAFQGTIDVDPGPGVFNLTSAESRDVFLTRQTVLGALVWAKRFGGLNDDLGESVAIDTNGNVVIAGRFSESGDFDPGPGLLNFNSAGLDDIFVVKLSSSGNLLWAHRFGSNAADGALGVDVTPSGDVLVAGYFSNSVDFDPGAGTSILTHLSGDDVFAARYDAVGNLVWARRLGGLGGDTGYDVASDPLGNAYVTGRISGSVTFGPSGGSLNLTSAGSDDAFVMKLDAAGNLVWGHRSGSGGSDVGVGLATDANGDVVVAGYFSGSADFDPGAGTIQLTSQGQNDAFIWRLTSAGTASWARQIGGPSNDGAFSVTVNSAGSSYVTGYFNNTVDFDPGPGTVNLTSAGGQDVFVLALDASGAHFYAQRFGGTGLDEGNGISVNSSNRIAFAGRFQNTIDVDPGLGVSNLIGGGSDSGFVVLLSTELFTPDINLLGNGQPIASGDGMPSATDHTDFGGVRVDADTLTRTFTIQNTGEGVLNLTGTPLVQVSGPHASNFTVTTLPAASVYDGQSTTFQITFDPSAGGLRTATVTIQSDDADEGSYTFAIQGTGLAPPKVTGVYVRGTGDASGSGNDEWSTAFLTHLGTQALGDAVRGFRISTVAGQLTPVPWTNVDTVAVQFNEAVTIVSGDLQIVGAIEGAAVPSLAGFSYDAPTFTATWRFATAFRENRYLLYLAGTTVVDVDNQALDGEWTDSVSTQSGNGLPGGAFSFGLNLLPGDANGSSAVSVTNADLLLAKQQLQTDTSLGAGYFHRYDVNGSGAITNADVLSVKQRLQTTLFDFSDPVPPPPGESFGEESFAGGTLLDESAVPPNARLTEPWHTAPGSTDAALAEPVAPSSADTALLDKPAVAPDLEAWDAAILAMYGQTKK